MKRRSSRTTPPAAAALLALAAACAPGSPSGGSPPSGPQPVPEAEAALYGDTIRPPGKYVVVDVEHNELRFMEGDHVLWRAPVGTGTGFRLRTDDEEWEFSTPTGLRHVQYKALEPDWVAPDWWFVENGRPVPPRDDPGRRVPGGLGIAAVFLGEGIAIHGTDKPELLGQRVSHGCIRLANEFALRLFHNVQVGTPVMIVGEAPVVHEEMPDSAAAFTRAARKESPPNPLLALSTAELLDRLDAELAADRDTARAWTATASELMRRGLDDDAIALRGLLARADEADTPARRAEYATFLADAWSRGSLRAAVSLNRIPEDARDRAAHAIVEATMSLYHGPLDSRLVPWPTRRLPSERLGPEGRQGWAAVAAAEGAWRERVFVTRTVRADDR